jgi:hypothetical protein
MVWRYEFHVDPASMRSFFSFFLATFHLFVSAPILDEYCVLSSAGSVFSCFLAFIFETQRKSTQVGEPHGAFASSFLFQRRARFCRCPSQVLK